MSLSISLDKPKSATLHTRDSFTKMLRAARSYKRIFSIIKKYNKKKLISMQTRKSLRNSVRPAAKIWKTVHFITIYIIKESNIVTSKKITVNKIIEKCWQNNNIYVSKIFIFHSLCERIPCLINISFQTQFLASFPSTESLWIYHHYSEK